MKLYSIAGIWIVVVLGACLFRNEDPTTVNKTENRKLLVNLDSIRTGIYILNAFDLYCVQYIEDV